MVKHIQVSDSAYTETEESFTKSEKKYVERGINMKLKLAQYLCGIKKRTTKFAPKFKN